MARETHTEREFIKTDATAFDRTITAGFVPRFIVIDNKTDRDAYLYTGKQLDAIAKGVAPFEVVPAGGFARIVPPPDAREFTVSTAAKAPNATPYLTFIVTDDRRFADRIRV